VKQPVVEALNAMEDAEFYLRWLGRQNGTAPDVAFTCGLKVGRMEWAGKALRDHEERSERARAAARKARQA
jgi:hypothetical protein